jgi:site-specific DNA-methyltransferase (adenine-specific)
LDFHTKLGKAQIQLRWGNCLELMKQIPDGSIDMVLCDPPYGVTDLAWDTRLPSERLWAEYRRVAKPNAAIVLFAQQPYATELIVANWKAFRYEWIWDKKSPTGFGNARRRPLRAHENILVFCQEASVYHPQGLRPLQKVRRLRPANTAVYGHGLSSGGVQRFTNWPRSILEFARGHVERPCQKPVPLLEYLIRTYSNPGDAVLDNTMGTGTTGVAAVRAGRGFIGFERDLRAFAGAKFKIREAIKEARRAKN